MIIIIIGVVKGGAAPRAAFGRTPQCKANSEASIMGDRSVRAPEIVVQGLTIHGTHGIHPLLKQTLSVSML